MKTFDRTIKNMFLRFMILISMAILGDFAVSQKSESILISQAGDTVVINPISLLDINPKIGEFNAQLNQINEELKIVPEIFEIDTSSMSVKEYFDIEHRKITEDLDKFTLVKIENAEREWQGYAEKLEDWDNILSKRITAIEETIFKIDVNKLTWELTRNLDTELGIPTESLNRIDEVINTSKNYINKSKDKQDTLIIIQNRITDFQIMVDDILELLDKQKTELQSEYFIKDSPAIWNAGDSTIKVKNAVKQFRSSTEGHRKSFQLFAENNSTNSIAHLILFIVLLVLFYYLNRNYKKQEHPDNEGIGRIQYFLSRYILSSFLFAIGFALLIYTSMPQAVRELFSLLILIPTIVIYFSLIPKQLRTTLFIIVILYLFDEFQAFFTAKTLLTRLLMFVQNILYIWIMRNLIRPESHISSIVKPGWLKTINRTGNTLIVFATVAVFCNVIGYVNLSVIISNALTSALIAPIALNLLIYIFNAFFNGLFKTKLFQNSYIIKLYGKKILSSIYTFLIYLAIFLWIRSILIALGLSSNVGEWLIGLMKKEWEWGSVTISFGGIIGFFVVILITWIVTKSLRHILEDEIFPRIKLSRGVPGAISMVVRYTLVAFGIYVALSAAGIDLGQFGLIAGALGVGIGFGLQGVVYNFIAGLILAFERPIQKGDTIELGTLFGDVISIGVRASTIKTYDGSEVIVPNGNLISNELINWTLSDRRRRREVKVHVAYGNDPHDIMDLLFKVVSENENVLPQPKPWPLFDGFGDSSLDFRIMFWVEFDRGLTIQSEVSMNIYDALMEAGIQIPFPQTDMHVKSCDPTVQETELPFSKKQVKRTSRRKPDQNNNQDDKK